MAHTTLPSSSRRPQRKPPALLAYAALLSFSACGGGGGGNPNAPASGNAGGWTPGVFLPSGSFAAQCVAPRSGNHPLTGNPWPDVAGTRTDENDFLRAFSHETYLWYDEIPDRNPALFDSSLAYFDELKTQAVTASGAPKDRFHFTFDTAAWLELSQSGVAPGYGAEWVILASAPPRRVLVAFTQPGSPATAAGVDLARGAEVLSVDGTDVVNGSDTAALNAGLFPASAGETHSFVVRDAGAGNTRQVTMTSTAVTQAPVQNVTTHASSMGTVGYLLFNDHIATAESALKDAVEQLAAAGIAELVLDIRYNGGGFLAIASQLAYMIAGDAATAGRVFEEIEFNDQHPTTNPVTGQPLQPMPFFDSTVGLSSLPAGQPLPGLDLPRVLVLTGTGTCSASESVMNSLRGVGVEVVQIGSITCGKPYGFFPTDNCGTTYFTIQFRGINEAGFGDYTDGFAPQNAPITPPAATLPGCFVADDFTQPLGDPLEGRLQAALGYIEDGSCPATPAAALAGQAKTAAQETVAQETAAGGRLLRPPWRDLRILRGAGELR